METCWSLGASPPRQGSGVGGWGGNGESSQMQERPVPPWACPLHPRALPDLQRLCRGEASGEAGQSEDPRKFWRLRNPASASVSCSRQRNMKTAFFQIMANLRSGPNWSSLQGPQSFKRPKVGGLQPRECSSHCVTVSKAWGDRWAEDFSASRRSWNVPVTFQDLGSSGWGVGSWNLQPGREMRDQGGPAFDVHFTRL